MKNKTKTKTVPVPISAGTGILQHYWNTDTTKLWGVRELKEAVGDTSTLQPLPEPGHQPFPGWGDFACALPDNPALAESLKAQAKEVPAIHIIRPPDGLHSWLDVPSPDKGFEIL